MNLMTPENTDRLSYVKGLLAMHRIKNRQIAEAIGVTDTAVCRLLSGRMKSRRVQEAVADLLNMTYQDVWGHQTQADSIFNRNRRGRQ